MSASKLNMQIVQGIARIEFYHPKANVLSMDVCEELSHSIGKAQDDESVRVIEISSKGEKTFSAGAFLDEVRQAKSEEDSVKIFSQIAETLLSIVCCSKLVICRVQGPCVGGAVGLVAACDYSMATKDSKFMLSELNLNLGPHTIGPLVEAKIGKGNFANMSIDTKWRSSDWALNTGLIAELSNSNQELSSNCSELLRNLSEKSPAALLELKSLFWGNRESFKQQLMAKAKISGKLAFSAFE